MVKLDANMLRPGQECLRYLVAPTFEILLKDRVRKETLPSTEAISDKGKADYLVKLLTLWQVLWLIVQSIARRVQNLPLTTLELSALAYVPCAVFAYFLWWHKPYESTSPTQLLVSPELTAVAFMDLAAQENIGVCKHSRHGATCRLIEINPKRLPTKTFRTYEITKQCGEILRSSLLPVDTLAIPSAIVFFVIGGIHLVIWDFAFPSATELWLWRICSLIITVIIPIS